MKTKCIISAKTAINTKIVHNKSDLISIILICDNPGYRMKSYGPTSLITINDHKLIDLQIKTIQQLFSNFEIILCVGFDSEKICRYIRAKYEKINIRVVENQLFNNTNSCESVRLSLNNTLNHKILLCDGNLLFNHKALSLIDTDQTCVLIETNPCSNLEVGININDNNEAQYFSFGAYRTWSEILFLHNTDYVEAFRKIVAHKDNKNKFIFEALNEMLKTKHKIKCINNQHGIKKISDIKTYHAMRGKT
jgi:hypothetical protein